MDELLARLMYNSSLKYRCSKVILNYVRWFSDKNATRNIHVSAKEVLTIRIVPEICQHLGVRDVLCS